MFHEQLLRGVGARAEPIATTHRRGRSGGPATVCACWTGDGRVPNRVVEFERDRPGERERGRNDAQGEGASARDIGP